MKRHEKHLNHRIILFFVRRIFNNISRANLGNTDYSITTTKMQSAQNWPTKENMQNHVFVHVPSHGTYDQK